MKWLAALALVPPLLVGCTVFGPRADAVMCDVAADLATARALVQQASLEGATGNENHAQALAGKAQTIARDANELLHTIKDEDVMRGKAWQALLVAYLHAGQAANSLLPEFANTHGIAVSELANAANALDAAALELPSHCFDERLVTALEVGG